MRFTSLVSAVVLSAVVNGADHQVVVGPDLNFHPNSLTAATGDTVTFMIGKMHSVQSGAFESPCVTSDTGFSSGAAFAGPASFDSSLFQITINNTTPIFGFCGTLRHCEDGMVFAINPSSTQTLAAFKAAANMTSVNTKPRAKLQGGILIESANTTSTSTASVIATTSTATAATSAGATTTGSATNSAVSTATTAGASPNYQGFGSSVAMGLAGLLAYMI